VRGGWWQMVWGVWVGSLWGSFLCLRIFGFFSVLDSYDTPVFLNGTLFEFHASILGSSYQLMAVQRDTGLIFIFVCVSLGGNTLEFDAEILGISFHLMVVHRDTGLDLTFA